MASTAWKDSAYDESYSTTLASLRRRRAEDTEFTLDGAKGVLKHLYVQDGNNWVGRGELQDIVMQATLDAYESFVSEWESSGR
ncbi:MAG: hypothetical protein KKA67_00970 [Spirochaetes bacterium]|nr:hypothetical protein [Spirochaetota bacterium]MBU1081444.1 hypothetical protein [Spirochaetota bacterium]